MFPRLLGAPVLLTAAVGVPYLATNGPSIDGLLDNFAPAQQTAPAPDVHQQLLADLPRPRSRPAMPQGPGATLYPTDTPIEGSATMSLAEVFNFGVTKEWVYSRWSRKSTALSELGMFGVRVPLVTGTQIHDLAGSLTYFFGTDARVHRIDFEGTTGDTTQLVTLVAQQYGLRPQATRIAGEQLFQVRRGEQVFSQLKTRPAPVLWSSSPHDSFSVRLRLQHPSINVPLPFDLPAMPPVAPAPQPTAQERSQPQQAAAKSSAKQATSAPEKAVVDPREKWEVFFPRSRVPKPQVDSLDRRGQLW
ncbi:MAG: DUF6690 family protein [Planctomycetota bacterium]